MLQLKREKIRVYQKNNRFYPSVTTIISQTFGMSSGMADWIAKVTALKVLRTQRAELSKGAKPTQEQLVEIGKGARNEILLASQVLGRRIHKACEEYVRTGIEPVFTPEEVKLKYNGYFAGAKQYFADFPTDSSYPPLQEFEVIDEDYGYAGTLDLHRRVLHPNGSRPFVLEDFKTSNFLQITYGLQLSAYTQTLRKLGLAVDGQYIVHLNKNGTYALIKYDEPFENFLNVLQVFNWKVAIEQPEFEIASQKAADEVIEQNKKSLLL